MWMKNLCSGAVHSAPALLCTHSRRKERSHKHLASRVVVARPRPIQLKSVSERGAVEMQPARHLPLSSSSHNAKYSRVRFHNPQQRTCTLEMSQKRKRLKFNNFNSLTASGIYERVNGACCNYASDLIACAPITCTLAWSSHNFYLVVCVRACKTREAKRI